MKIRIAATAALALAAVLALAACGTSAGAGSQHGDGMDHGRGSSASADFTDADVMFAHMMIPHHEQAIEMSDMLLAKEGIDENVVTLAEDIKAAQQPEIEQMRGWLEDWDANLPDAGGRDHSSGMMGEGDMAALDAATGADASRLYLEQMIAHHEGAIDMAQDEVDNGRNPAAVELARSIIETQTAEIATMQELLAGL